jgi:hypothetical protein
MRAVTSRSPDGLFVCIMYCFKACSWHFESDGEIAWLHMMHLDPTNRALVAGRGVINPWIDAHDTRYCTVLRKYCVNESFFAFAFRFCFSCCSNAETARYE